MFNAKIEELRKRIDSIDKDILDLILERRDCALNIGALKDQQSSFVGIEHIGAYDSKREEEIVSRLKLLGSSLPSNGIEAIYREIISLCRNEAHKVTVCLFDGAPFLYSLALKLLGRSCTYKVCKGKEDFIESLKGSKFNIGLATEPLSIGLVESLKNIGYKMHKSMLPFMEGDIRKLETFIFTHI